LGGEKWGQGRVRKKGIKLPKRIGKEYIIKTRLGITE